MLFSHATFITLFNLAAKDEVTKEVMLELAERSRKGYKKYGTTLHENNHQNMLQHAYEEALDFAQYLKKENLSKKKSPSEINALLNLCLHFYYIAYNYIRKKFMREQWLLLFKNETTPSFSVNGFKIISPPKDRFWAKAQTKMVCTTNTQKLDR